MNTPTAPYQTDGEPADLEYELSALASAGDRQFATTLAKGLEILRCFTQVKPVLGNTELAECTGLSPQTISRFTYTLSKLGYLRVDPATGRYRLGPAVISMGYPVLAAITLRQVARPLMNELATALRSSVSMGIRDRLSIVYVETSRSNSVWSAQMSEVGLRYPIASTAIGHALVAGSEPLAREGLLNEIKVRTPVIWRRYRERLQQAQKEFERKGFCSSYGEQHTGYSAVAVPVGRASDGELIVLNCVVESHMASRETIEGTFGPKLVAMAEQLRQAVQFT